MSESTNNTNTNTVTVIHCWSAPRSRSTAVLYAMEARGCHCCLDEPLYTAWLQAHPHVYRPYREALITGEVGEWKEETKKMLGNGNWKEHARPFAERLQEAVAVAAAFAAAASDKGGNGGGGVVFCKHMAKHVPQYDFSLEEFHTPGAVVRHVHVLLIRHPVAILSSWEASKHVHSSQGDDAQTQQPVGADEVGLVDLLSLYSRLQATPGRCWVLDSDALARDPAGTFASLCRDLGLAYHEKMLTWPTGPHAAVDGPWAPWWYQAVHASTGWQAAGESDTTFRTLPPHLLPLLHVSWPAYTFLQHQTVTYQQRAVVERSVLYEDDRNETVLCWIGSPSTGRLVPRQAAGVSPFDSSVQGGDACWEGLRVYRGKVLSLEKHLRRLQDSSKALGFTHVHSNAEIKTALFHTLAANGMRDGAHVRLTLTRGEKSTSSMNPAFNVYGTTLIVLAEWKPVTGRTTYDNTAGITLVTSAFRRHSPQTGVDSKIHHNNMINNILPKMQANLVGAQDALMLDAEGFVSETNATNIFMVRDGVLVTPTADYCLPGITRGTILELAQELQIVTEVRRVSLAEFYAADEVFTTGTMGELTPVQKIDGRLIGDGTNANPVTRRLQEVYQTLPERPGWATALPDF